MAARAPRGSRAVTAARRIARREPVAVPAELAARYPPVLARVLAARAVRHAGEVDYVLGRLASYAALGGIDAAVAVLRDALHQGARILVVGDYDADGATSSALVVRCLRAFGAAAVDFLVPNRFAYGYGLTPELVAVAAGQSPDVLITVDNGIASVAGAAAARERGMRVVITDHHLPGESLPAADAIVNPNLPGDGFPSKHLAGVGVAFYLMAALRARLRDEGWFAARGLAEPTLAEHLDLVALGTVADVVPLDHNNRVLVAQGLARMRAGRCRPGIRALAQHAGRELATLTAADLGFAIAPRLNAAGRLEDMAVGIECLVTDDPHRAFALAARLDDLNRERRTVEAGMQARADAILGDLETDARTLPLGVCLYDPSWHEGVIGILASRVKERLHRPVVAFAPAAAAPGELRGSARSVAGLHVRDAIAAVATRHPGLVGRYGGHAMAAGLSLPAEHWEPFREAFDAEVRQHLADADLCATVWSDGPLAAADLCLETAEHLRAAGPWGNGFPEPVFDGEFEVVQRRIVGERHLKLVLRCPGEEPLLDAIAFNTTDAEWPEIVTRVRLAYRLDVNAYRGRRSLQLMVEALETLP